MPSCFVPGCPNKYRSTIGIPISYHRFPNTSQRNWLEAIGIDPTIFISNEVVRSDHFTEDDFEKTEKRRILKPGVIPSQSFSSRSIEPGPSKRVSNREICVEQETASSTKLFKRRCEGSSSSSSSPHIKRRKTKSPSSSSANSSVKRRLVRTFHNYCKVPNENSNEEKLLNQKNRVLTDRIKFLTKKLKNAQKTNRRKTVKIKTLSQIVIEMKRKFSLSTETTLALEASTGGIPSFLMKRFMINSNKKGKKLTKQKFPPELRSFAMTLQFYSAKAYNYVRETFNLALPAPATISKWLSKIDCSPGFTQQSLECLKIKSEDFKKRFNKPLLCALMLDEMSIKKELVSDRHTQQLWGYTDIGAEIDNSNEQELATEVLVLMVVAINDNFKIPIAYFYTNKLSGEEKANIVLEALRQLCHTSCKIVSITCDGPSVHFKMMKSLGCQVSDPTNIKNYFMHPVDHHKVFVIFDICHMLKLVRNNWARMGVIIDPEGNEVKWEFIQLLYKYQENETLHLANKLKSKHIEWRSVKMKVNVAAQTLSNSVAEALTFISESLHVEEFKNVSHTVKFIKYIDQLFDILNSRNIYAKRMKMPMKQETSDKWKPFIDEALKYLQHCKTKEGIPIYKTKKRTPILGFIVSAKSMINIYESEIVQNENLKYLLTYKFSQDHLELFFCSVRSRNGWVNNPNCQQFRYTYRRLLMHQTQKDCHGNCIAQDQTNVLTQNSAAEPITISDIQKNRKSEDKQNRELEDLESKISLFLPSALGEYAENIVAYLSGFVVTKLEKKIKCFKCLRALLYLEEFDELDNTMKFLDFKNKGGLTYCSRDVRKICSKIEKKIQLTWKLCGNLLPKEYNFMKILLKEVYIFMEDVQLFRSLDDHVFDYAIEDMNHKKILIENIIRVYGSIRINSICGKINERVTGVNIRKTYSKLILFKNQ